MSTAPSPPNLRTLARTLSRGLRACFVPFLIFDLAFKAVVFVALGPLTALLLRYLISATGGAALSNTEILWLALTPRGLMSTLALGTVALVVAWAETAGHTAIAYKSLTGKPLSGPGALLFTVTRLPWLLLQAALQATLYLLALAPFLAAGVAIYVVLLSDFDIYYLVNNRPPVFWVGAALTAILAAGALTVLLFLYLRWVFTLPAMLFGKATPWGAFRKSSDLVRPNRGWVFRIFLTWLFLIVAAPIVATKGIETAAFFILARVGQNMSVAVVFVALVVIVYSLALLLITFVATAGSGLLLAISYSAVSSTERSDIEELEPTWHVRMGGRRLIHLRKSRALVVAAIVLLIVTTLVSLSFTRGLEWEPNVAVTAHRGSALTAPENTLSAIEQAIIDGADFAEIDVQLTADSFVVLVHDEDLRRIARIPDRVGELTYHELASIDAGGWFAPTFAGEHIPTLEEAIETARGRIRLNVELKAFGRGEALAERVVVTIRQTEFVEQAVVSSLSLSVIQHVRSLDPDIPIGLIVAQSVGDITRLEVDFLAVSDGMATRGLVGAAHRAGREIHVWSITDPQRMAEFIDMGVDNILTKDPATLRSVLEERANMTDVEKLLLTFGNWLHR